jgi:O-antigen ligase
VTLVPLFAYAVFLTQSRGGFISFVGGLAVLAWMRFGWRRTAIIGVVGLPLLLILFAGRQTELSTKSGTAQTRVELWRDWMMTFRENPIFGAGMSLPKEDDLKNRRPDEEKHHLAHNSFLQGFADLGFVGGCLLVGAFFTALWSLYRYNADDSILVNADLKTLQPYLVAGIAAYALGMMTLTICYIVPTFMMLAIAVAFTQMAQRSALAAPAPMRFDLPLVGRFAAVGCCFLASIYLFVRFLA